MKALAVKLAQHSAFLKRMYRRVFSITEIAENGTLQWLFGASLFYFFITFDAWIMSSRATVENAANAICWPHYQDCGWLYFLSNLPNGYSHTTFYMVLYAAMLAVVYCMWKKYWDSAHALVLLLFVWKFFVGFVLSYGVLGMYDYYHLIFTAALLFIPHKEYFIKLLFVVLYFVSATIKFHPSWVLGTYFSTLQAGLPLIPDALMPLATNSVIFEQVVGCWFLLSRNKILQRIALIYFTVFHLYSGIFVLYNYPSATLPLLLILFGPMYRYQRPPVDIRSILGWVFVIVIFLFQIPSWMGSIDATRLTVGNNRYGMWMFDANHQCVTTIKYHYRPDIKFTPESSTMPSCSDFECVTKMDVYQENGAWVREVRRESAVSWKRCDPYEKWTIYKNQCAERYTRISMQLDHSINGEPFFRIIDVPNVCTLQYNLFGSNSWIATPPDAPAIGIPVKNVYRYRGQQ